MTSDKRPDQRFAMLALELTTEVTANPGPPTAPSLMMVNGILYCPSCSALTLHSKQVDKAKPTAFDTFKDLIDKINANADKNRTRSEFETRTSDWIPNKPIRPSAGVELQAVLRDLDNLDRYYDGAQDGGRRLDRSRDTAGLFVAMTSILGLRNFDEYAIEKRRDNARAGIKDLDRRTGRTLRGIVGTLARNYQEGPIKAWVIGGSAIVDQWLLGEMQYVCRALDRRAVVDVMPGSNDVRAGYRELKVPPWVTLFVDHTFGELLTFKSKMTYKP